MKIYFLAILFLLTSFSIQAQFEASKKKVNIPAEPGKANKKSIPASLSLETSTAPVIKFESQYFKNSDEQLLKSFSTLPKIGEIDEKKSIPIRNATELYEEKIQEKMKSEGLSQEILESDMFLGEFNVYTTELTTNCRDYSAIDGDDIRIWLNGVVVVKDVGLESDFKTYKLELIDGINIIEIEALNIGLSFPNTGQFVFYDGNGKLITNQNWGLDAGYKAIIKINKRSGVDSSGKD